jgi:hypothetical protein
VSGEISVAGPRGVGAARLPSPRLEVVSRCSASSSDEFRSNVGYVWSARLGRKAYELR